MKLKSSAAVECRGINGYWNLSRPKKVGYIQIHISRQITKHNWNNDSIINWSYDCRKFEWTNWKMN